MRISFQQNCICHLGQYSLTLAFVRSMFAFLIFLKFSSFLPNQTFNEWNKPKKIANYFILLWVCVCVSLSLSFVVFLFRSFFLSSQELWRGAVPGIHWFDFLLFRKIYASLLLSKKKFGKIKTRICCYSIIVLDLKSPKPFWGYISLELMERNDFSSVFFFFLKKSSFSVNFVL